MPEFPHLNLKQKLVGWYHFIGRRIEKKIEVKTQANLTDRTSHGNSLLTSTNNLIQEHSFFLEEREKNGLPPVFSERILPLFLKVDPKDFDIESLKGFGIEIVSEEDDGFIVGANADGFYALSQKIEKFIKEEGQTKNTAMLWQIIQGNQWRVEYILSEGLQELYRAGIPAEEQFFVDISVACYKKYPERPYQVQEETEEKYAELKERSEKKKMADQGKQPVPYRARKMRESDENFATRLGRWEKTTRDVDIERDRIAMERQDYLTYFIEKIYKGKILSGFIDMGDSFGFKAEMSGQALKDLIDGYAYLFEVTESENINEVEDINELNENDGLEILPPPENAPVICVIDSGIQEGHILLAPAIRQGTSINYVLEENTTADQVANGGHGTKVAGGILFGNEIPTTGQYAVNCFLANARILNSNCDLPNSLYPPQLMVDIVNDFNYSRIFNLSVASRGPSRTTHMSAWAAAIDKLIHERKILFLIAAGNIRGSSQIVMRPGISEQLQAGRDYPGYLLERTCRIANPSQSLLGLTVGSVCTADFEDADRISFGRKDYVSSFSRIGLGLWGSIKPDIVEYGGDFLREKNGYLITQHDDISTRVVKTGAGRVGTSVGTSFATPKVSHIAAALAAAFPKDSVLLYKTLIVQSARLPEHVFYQPNIESLKMLGYGIPDKTRSLENTPFRITFFAEGNVAPQQANLYSVKIPDSLRRAGNNYDILVEVTLTYTAIPRRTRRRLKSYFSSWLSWDSSKLGEKFDVFTERVLQDLEEENEEPQQEPVDKASIRWTLWSSPGWGKVKDVKRQDSATQKDWVVLKSNALPEEFSIAVIGHKGWNKDTSEEIPFALAISFESISQEAEIYKEIEAVNKVDIETLTEVTV